MDIYVKIVKHWEKRTYPDCDTSRLLAELSGKTTLTPGAIDAIKKLGYIIKTRPSESITL